MGTEAAVPSAPVGLSGGSPGASRSPAWWPQGLRERWPPVGSPAVMEGRLPPACTCVMAAPRGLVTAPGAQLRRMGGSPLGRRDGSR